MRRTARIAALPALVSLLLAGCASQRATPIDQASTQDGLEPVAVKGFDAVYRKPQIDLSKYDRILLKPVQVAFRKDWRPERDDLFYSMNPPDREQIKKSVAENFADVFRRELQERGGYQIVNRPGSGVLGVEAAIIDLFINAPDVSMQTASRVSMYTVDTGEMTLVAELRDSVTGEILARAYDHDSGNNTGWVQPANEVWNTAEARRAMQVWASALRRGLDAARAAPSK